MSEENIMPISEQGSDMVSEQIIFWDSKGEIIPHRLYDYFRSIGIGNYFPDDANKKNSEPIIVKITGNIVS